MKNNPIVKFYENHTYVYYSTIQLIPWESFMKIDPLEKFYENRTRSKVL